MATVYLAHDLKHDRSVALKVVHPEIVSDVGVERFLREIRLTARLTHPHILPVLDSGTDAGRLWYTMPYVRGESLRDRLRRDVQLPIDNALAIARQTALALDYAHREGVVHRDVKPENVLLSGDQAFVMDFGVARAAICPGDKPLTTNGLVVGTPAYMAPEQAAGGRIDARADVYALGCVLYEMLAGEPPFTGPTPRAVMARSVAGEIPPLRTIRPSVTRALDQTILKALSRVPADRFASAAELARALPGHSTSAGAPRRTWALIGLAAIGLAIAGYVTFRAQEMPSTSTLLSSGALKERERVLVADFETHTSDSLLGLAATEAFRIDFSQTSVVTTVSPPEVARILEQMRRSAGARLDPVSAREVARRAGIGAIVTGDITPVADAYLVSVQLVSSHSGQTLAALRERAPQASEIISAIDRLSRRLRETIGESLKTLRAEPPLDSVTTASLEALQKYSLATRLAMGRGDFQGAIPLLEEAVALDSGFAMAYRALGTYRGQVGDRAGQVAGLTAAFEHRNRLSSREAAHTRAAYFDMVTHESGKAIAAYRGILAQNPDDRVALLNLALLYADRRDYATAESLDVQAVALDSTNWIAYLNLMYAQAAQGKRTELKQTLDRALTRFPNLPAAELEAIAVETSAGNYEAAERLALAFEDRRRRTLPWGVIALRRLAELAAVQGKLAEAESRLSAAMAASDQAGDTTGYLELAFDRAQIDIFYRGQRRRGLLQIERALRRYPMRSLPAPDRPYLSLAFVQAVAGDASSARRLVDQYLQAVEPDLRDNSRYLYRSVMGEIAMTERRPAEALKQFRQNTYLCPMCGLADVARAYDALGMIDSSLATYERYVATPDIDRLTDDSRYLAHVYKRVGELHARRGEERQARDYYARFMGLWNDADPELQSQVLEVRRRMADLKGAPNG